jgi:type IV fimbrial biogenesis protein FimT
MNIMRRRRTTSGLTIIELIIVVAVIGILIAVVAPSMRGMMARQQVQGINAELVTDLQLARSEVARRSGGGTSVGVTFGGDAQITCYTIHTIGPGAACDCTRTPGQACLPAGMLDEIKTVQVKRASGVSLAASSAGGTALSFTPPQGFVTPADLVVDVQGDVSGRLRTTINASGRPTVCSPDSSIRGVPITCAP